MDLLSSATCSWTRRRWLGQVNVLASMFFGGVTGAAVADVCALGRVEIDMMTEAG